MRPLVNRQSRWVCRRRQQGQALVYGLFALTAGLAALFFMFQTGQLALEKTKLVNTADAVAYSAGVMHARALNFDAYTNRALVANEVMLAQLVSMASWAEYTASHARSVPPLMCISNRPVPVLLGLLTYQLACAAVSPPIGSTFPTINIAVQGLVRVMVPATEAAKSLLVGSQSTMLAGLLGSRAAAMQQVAEANYRGDGSIQVDSIPLTDDFFVFNGAPILELNTDGRRTRMRDLAVTAANRDEFVRQRSWTDTSIQPCIVAPGGQFRRRGGTEMIGLEEWKAMDTGSLHLWHFKFSLWNPGCKDDGEIPMAYAARAAANGINNDGGASYGGVAENPSARTVANLGIVRYGYSGIPDFYELRQDALDYGPDNADPDRRELRIRFSIRLTRARDQTKTADGRSSIKPTGALDGFRGQQAGDVLAAVATSEVFFERPDRTGAPEELASLFNPFWHVRLAPTPAATMAVAQTLGGPR